MEGVWKEIGGSQASLPRNIVPSMSSGVFNYSLDARKNARGANLMNLNNTTMVQSEQVPVPAIVVEPAIAAEVRRPIGFPSSLRPNSLSAASPFPPLANASMRFGKFQLKFDDSFEMEGFDSVPRLQCAECGFRTDYQDLLAEHSTMHELYRGAHPSTTLPSLSATFLPSFGPSFPPMASTSSPILPSLSQAATKMILPNPQQLSAPTKKTPEVSKASSPVIIIDPAPRPLTPSTPSTPTTPNLLQVHHSSSHRRSGSGSSSFTPSPSSETFPESPVDALSPNTLQAPPKPNPIPPQAKPSGVQFNRIVKCRQCGIFVHAADLPAHDKIHLELPEPMTVECSTCGKMFKDQENLEKHVRKSHAPQSYPCHLCGKVLPTPSYLSLHLKSHSALRLYKCTCCDFLTNDKGALDTHMTTLHPNDKNYKVQKALEAAKMFQCPSCNHRAKTKLELDIHVSLSHKKDASDPPTQSS